MPSTSRNQQRAAGIALAAKRGELPKSKLRGASKQMSKMSSGNLRKFAKTKHKGLPKKKGESLETEIRSLILETPDLEPQALADFLLETDAR